MSNQFKIFILLGVFISACSSSTNVVRNQEEFKSAVASAQPGTTITLANGEWKDVELRGSRRSNVSIQPKSFLLLIIVLCRFGKPSEDFEPQPKQLRKKIVQQRTGATERDDSAGAQL